MPRGLEVAYLILLMVAWPIYDRWVGWPAFQRRLRTDPHGARVREYGTTVTVQWSFVLGAVLCLGADPPWGDLGLRVPHGWRLWVALGLVVALAAGYRSQARKIARSAELRGRVRRALGALDVLLPRTRAELGWFLVLSVTAGFCEEFLFRGYVIRTLAPLFTWWGAALVSVVAFGLLHAYQGPKGIVRTAIVGAVFTVIVWATGSLLPAMALHAIVDVGSGTAGWLALREPAPAPA